MARERFSSPREEALEIALITRKNILSGNDDSLKILHACVVIASNLGKSEEVAWMNRELSGAFTKAAFP
jgi:hypothetical protein